MLTRSAKNKGRRACERVKELILAHFPELKDGDVMIPTTSVPGSDLHLSPAAKDKLPVVIEVKNQETISIWSALRQAESHGPETALLFFQRNHSDLYVALRADHFFHMIKK